MENPGVYTLCALQIGAPLSAQKQVPIIELDGMTAVTLDVDFKYGTGGTSVSVIVATSFDGGTTLRHIARFDFATASAVKQCNLEGLLSKAVGAYADLAAEGVNDGILGSQLSVIVTSVGTYANTLLSVRASVR